MFLTPFKGYFYIDICVECTNDREMKLNLGMYTYLVTIFASSIKLVVLTDLCSEFVHVRGRWREVLIDRDGSQPLTHCHAARAHLTPCLHLKCCWVSGVIPLIF